MAGAIMDKVWGLFGMDQAENEEPEETDYYNYEDNTAPEVETNEEDERRFFGNGRKGKVVPMTQQNSQSVKMVISQPTTFKKTLKLRSIISTNEKERSKFHLHRA